MLRIKYSCQLLVSVGYEVLTFVANCQPKQLKDLATQLTYIQA
uniref:Uncharacterized protein n=1 Tax=Anguilla anguilla TaxID=7936 RepID=A0A0E9V4F2_ANGAN